jgi:hypothetical protein
MLNLHTEQFLFHRYTIRIDYSYSSYRDLRPPPEVNYFLKCLDMYYIYQIRHLQLFLACSVNDLDRICRKLGQQSSGMCKGVLDMWLNLKIAIMKKFAIEKIFFCS